MPLDRSRDDRAVEAVGAEADPAAAPTGADRQVAPERVEQQRQVTGLDHALDRLRLGERDVARKPAFEVLRRGFTGLAVALGDSIDCFGR